MRRIAWLALVLTACPAADTEDTDTDFPPGCIFRTTADTFIFGSVPIGSDSVGIIELEARCPEPLGLRLLWEEPTSGDFSFEGADTRTLQPYAPEELRITFAPSRAGAIEDKLIVRTDNPAAGGVILSLEGQGQ